MAKLLASDIDGTLLRSDGTVSQRTRAALRAALADGRHVVLATGRPLIYVRALATELGIDAPVVCANGAVLYDVTADEVLVEHGLPADVYEHVVERLRGAFDGLAFGVETARTFSCEPGFAELAVWPIPPGSVATNGTPLWEGAPSKILVRHPTMSLGEALAEVEAAVGDVATVTHSTPELLEIAALGVDKGAGLAKLAGDLGCGAADVVAFGDMPNDVAMLEWAGRGVAVANAHWTAIEAADEMTASNDDDGVAQVVEALGTL